MRTVLNTKQDILLSMKVIGFAFLVFFMGCVPAAILPPTQLRSPEPIEDNTGKYLCPYTSDGTVSEWVDKGLAARIGSSVGRYAGEKAGKKALENVPILGGWLGRRVGETVGRNIAIRMCGGWNVMRSSTDLSFNKMEDLAVWMYVVHSSDGNYNKVLELTMEVYPEMKTGYMKAIRNASKHASMQ